MPLYEYQCEACGQRFEIIQKFSEVSEACRLCGKGPIERLQSSPAIQFKGTGFYITDYAQKGKPGGESSEASKSEGTDAKPAADTTSSGEKSTKPAPAAAPASPAKTDTSS